MGMERKETSFSTSTNTPPRPNISTGPNVASLATPMMASMPGSAILCTDMPAIFLPEKEELILSKALLTPSSSAMFRTTPPASDLWTTSGESTFMATGQPRDRKISTAWSAV